MNNLHCYKFLKCIVFLSHICPCSLIKQTVSLYDYGFVHIYHKMLATAKSKKIDFDVGELFFYSPVPLDLKAELLGCLIWPEPKTAYHGERCQEQWCHTKQKLSSTNSKWSQDNLYFNRSHLDFLSGQEWFSFGQLNSVLIKTTYEMLWSLHSIWEPCHTTSAEPYPPWACLSALNCTRGSQIAVNRQ